MGRFRPNDRYDREGLCSFSWEDLYGTTTSGNLSQFIKNHEGNCWAPCPYSTQSITDISGLANDYESLYGTVDIYLKSRLMLGELPVSFVDHTKMDGTVVYLKPHYNGGWGYMCMFDGCPYYLATGKRYFYI